MCLLSKLGPNIPLLTFLGFVFLLFSFLLKNYRHGNSLAMR